MDNDFIDIPNLPISQILDIRPPEERVPQRITVIYELKKALDESISEKSQKHDPENSPG